MAYTYGLILSTYGKFTRSSDDPSFPFNRSGVDYAGPLKVRLSNTRGKGTTKGYIAGFIRLATRAVHLEI